MNENWIKNSNRNLRLVKEKTNKQGRFNWLYFKTKEREKEREKKKKKSILFPIVLCVIPLETLENAVLTVLKISLHRGIKKSSYLKVIVYW